MADIITRLRTEGSYDGVFNAPKIQIEAAEKIEEQLIMMETLITFLTIKDEKINKLESAIDKAAELAYEHWHSWPADEIKAAILELKK